MTSPAPYRIVLEFSRAQRAGQPHAFEFTPQPYLLRNPGGGFESAEFPWTAALLEDLRAARQPGRTPEAIHRLGETLRTFLAGAGWGHHEQAIVRAAREGAPIRITVRSAAAELYALPWEFVALKSTGQLIGGVPGLLVRYEWPEATTFPDRVDPTARRGRTLFVWSAAGGAVPADQHLAALRTAFADAPGAFDPARDVVAHATWGKIDEALDDAARRGPPIDAIHLLCHGAALGAGYGLALDDEAQPGAAVVVDAGRLQQLLAPHAGMVRLVVLSACDSGNAGEPGNHLGSVAQMIHRAGLQAVVASRFPLSTQGSTRLAESLFRALARDRAPLEEAFLDARDALLRDPGQLDWASIQLYARDDDGDATRPLNLSPGTATATPPPPPGPPVPSTRRLWLAGLGLAGLAAVAVAWAMAGPGGVPSPTDPPAAASTADPPPSTPPTTTPTATPTTSAPTATPTTGDPTTGDPTTGDPPPTKSPTKTKPPTTTPPKAPTDPGRPDLGPIKTPGACPAKLTSYLGNFLRDNPDGSESLKLSILIDTKGGVAVDNSRARTPLAAVDAQRAINYGGSALPCRTRVTWIP